MARFRLTIGTHRAATTFCIDASTEADALRRAAKIAAGWPIVGARVQVKESRVRSAQPDMADLLVFSPADALISTGGPVAAA